MDYANDSQALATLNKLEQERGLPAGVLRSIMIQETGGKAMDYHYQEDATGKRKSSAFGPFGILRDSTAVDPGYGVQPMDEGRWESFDEQARFAADYLKARVTQAGSLEQGLKGYGTGEDKYVKSVLGRIGVTAATTTEPGGGLGKYVDGRYVAADVLAGTGDAQWQGQGMPEVQRPGELTIKDLYSEKPAEVKDQLSQFDAGILETPSVALLEAGDSGVPEAWEPTDDEYKLFAEVEGMGKHMAEYVRGSKNRADFHQRVSRARVRHENDLDLNDRQEWQAAKGYAARMGGNFMDPVGLLATWGVGTGLNAVRSGAVLSGVGRNLASGAAVGAGTNVGLDMATQSLVNRDLLWGQVLQQGLYGATFGAALQIPRSVVGVRRVQGDEAASRNWDAATAELAKAIDEGASPEVISGLKATIDKAQARMLERAAREGDDIAVEVWAAAKPGADIATIQSTITKIKAQRKAAEDAVPEAGVPVIERALPAERIVGENNKAAPEGPAGTRLSRFAAEITEFAKTKWNDPVDPARAEMIRRQREFYDLRESKLDNYKGLANWLDSAGLQTALSKSQVVRMLGNTMYEIAGGLSSREGSMALRYEMLHSRMLHSVMQDLKEVELQSMRSVDKVRYLVGLSSPGRATFWRDVAIEGQKRRQAVANKQMDSYVSEASHAVQRAAAIMDSFWRDASEVMIKAGLPEGEAIKQGGWVGHIPYNWNWQKIARDFRDDLPAVEALSRMLRDEYREKVITPAIERLREQLPELQAKHKADLEGRVAAVQDEIAKLEQARKALSDTSDIAKSAAQEVKELNALRKTYVESERKLTAELKALEKELAKAPKGADEAPPTAPVMQPAEAPGIRDTSRAVMVENAGISMTGNNWQLSADFAKASSDPSIVANRGLKEVLTELANSPPAVLSKHERALAQAILDDLADDIPVLYSSKPGRAFFSGLGRTSADSPVQPFITMHTRLIRNGAEVEETPRAVALVTLHEALHSRTSATIRQVELWRAGKTTVSKPADHIIKAYDELDALRHMLAKEFPAETASKDQGPGYAVSNLHEFASQIANDAMTQHLLGRIILPGKRSALRVAWELFASLISNKQAQKTALTEAIAHISTISAHRQVFVEGGGRAVARLSPEVKKAGVTELRQQLAAIKAAKADTDARLVRARTNKRTAADARKSAAATSAGEKLRNLVLQLNKTKAELADHQTNPAAWGQRQLDKITKQATEKADSMAAAYIKRITQSPEERQRSALTHFADISAELLKENFDGAKISPELAASFKTMLSEKIGDRTRTEFNLLREDSGYTMLDFLNTDGLGIVKANSHRIAGQTALAERGFDDGMKISGAIEAARLDGATEAELKSLKFGFDFLSDNLQSGDSQGMHALRNATYAAYMGKLGISMMADIPQVAAVLGVSNMLRVMGSMVGQVLNGSLFIRDGKLTPLGRQLVQVAPGTMGMDHRLMTTIPDNIAGGMDAQGMGFLQRVTARGAQITSYLSGANAVNLAMHRALTPMLAEEMLQSVLGKGAINAARLADMGLSGKVLDDVRAQLLKHDSGRKAGDRINFDRWDDQAAAESMIEAIHRGTFQTLQRSLLGEFPTWMVDNPLGRIIGQFRRFSLTAAEKTTARQLGLADSGTATLFAVGMAWASLMWFARVHASTAGMSDKEAKEYVEENLQGARLARGVAVMFNASGLAGDVATVGEMLYGGNPAAGRGGPAAALGYVGNLAQAAAAPADILRGDGAAATRAVVKILPGGNSLMGTWLQNTLNKE